MVIAIFKTLPKALKKGQGKAEKVDFATWVAGRENRWAGGLRAKIDEKCAHIPNTYTTIYVQL